MLAHGASSHSPLAGDRPMRAHDGSSHPPLAGDRRWHAHAGSRRASGGCSPWHAHAGVMQTRAAMPLASDYTGVCMPATSIASGGCHRRRATGDHQRSTIRSSRPAHPTFAICLRRPPMNIRHSRVSSSVRAMHVFAKHPPLESNAHCQTRRRRGRRAQRTRGTHNETSFSSCFLSYGMGGSCLCSCGADPAFERLPCSI